MGERLGTSNNALFEYSVWLIPSRNSAYAELRNAINKISYKYSTPSFEPHVTLIGRLLVPEALAIEKISAISNMVGQIKVEFDQIDRTDKYFKSLFVRVKKSDALSIAANITREAFQEKHMSEYMPHLSLMYANMPSEMKDRIIHDCKLQALVDSIDYVAMDKVSLWHTPDDVRRWKMIREFELEKPVEEFSHYYKNELHSHYTAKTI